MFIENKLQYMVHCYFAAGVLDEDTLMDTAACNVEISGLVDNQEVLFINELFRYSQCIYLRMLTIGLGEIEVDVKHMCKELAECFWDIVVRDSIPAGENRFNQVSGMPDFDEFELDVKRVIS